MKIFSRFSIIFIAAALTLGCQEQEVKFEPQFEIVSSDTRFDGAGGQGVIVAQTNVEDIKVVSDVDWLVVTDVYFSSKRNTVTVSFETEANIGGDRIGRISLSSPKHNVTDEVEVAQEKLRFKASLSADLFSSAGGDGRILLSGVSASADAEVSVVAYDGEEPASWISFEDLSSLGEVEEGIGFHVSESPSSSERSAQIYVEMGGVRSDALTVMQTSVLLSVTDAGNTDFGVNSGKGVIRISTSATEVAAVSEAEWVVIEKVTTEAVEYAVSENAEGVLREASIVISVGEDTSAEVIIRQGAASVSVVDFPELMPLRGGESSIIFRCDRAASAHVNAEVLEGDWLTVKEVLSSEPDLGVVVIQAQAYPYEELGKERTAKVKVSIGMVVEVVEVKQTGRVSFETDCNEVSLTDGTTAQIEIPYITNADIYEPSVFSSADWLEVSVEDGCIVLEIASNYAVDRSTTIQVSLGDASVNIPISQKANLVELFDRSVVNALAAANSSVVSLNVTPYMTQAVSSWTVQPVQDWLSVTKNDDSSFTVGVTAYTGSRYDVRRGEINVLNENGVVIRTIEVYQMDKYALTGNWAIYNSKDELIGHIGLCRDEHVVTSTYKNSSYPDEDSYTWLEVHDFYFWGPANPWSQPWINIYSVKEGGHILELPTYYTGWGARALVPYNSIPYGAAGHKHVVDFKREASGNVVYYTGEGNGKEIQYGDMAFEFTYSLREGDDVMTITPNNAMSVEGLNGLLWLNLDSGNNFSVKGVHDGTPYWPDIAYMKRVYVPTETQRTYKGGLGDRNKSYSSDPSHYASTLWF